MGEKKFPLMLVIIIALLLLGGGVFFVTQTANNSSSQPKPTVPPEKPIELQTFYVDELNQPLDLNNADVALERNEARVDLTLEQIEQDEKTIDQLQKLFQ